MNLEKKKQGEELLEKARAKGNAVIEEAEALAQTKKEKIVAEAESQARETLNVAQKQIDQERQSMLSQVKGNMIDMTLRLNQKLFKDTKASKDFVEKNIDSL